MVNQATYLPWAILSQLTVTYFASDPYSTRNLPGPLNGMGSMKMAGLIQLFSWLSQFVGHGAAEGRAPALLDNLLQGESDAGVLCIDLTTQLTLGDGFCSGGLGSLLLPPRSPLPCVQL
jgi:hypothetical protein